MTLRRRDSESLARARERIAGASLLGVTREDATSLEADRAKWELHRLTPSAPLAFLDGGGVDVVRISVETLGERPDMALEVWSFPWAEGDHFELVSRPALFSLEHAAELGAVLLRVRPMRPRRAASGGQAGGAA